MLTHNTHYATSKLRLLGSLRLEDHSPVSFDFEYSDRFGYSIQGVDYSASTLFHIFVCDRIKSIVTDIFGSLNSLSVDRIIFYKPLNVSCWDYRFTVDWWDSDSFSSKVSYGILTIKVMEVK